LYFQRGLDPAERKNRIVFGVRALNKRRSSIKPLARGVTLQVNF
jgi:hypothetical protein